MTGKKKFTAGQVIEAARRYRGLKSRMAGALSCSVQTITNYEKEYVTVAEAIKEQRHRLVDLAENGLERQIRAGNVTAIIFALKTIGAERGYREPRREIGMEHAGRVRHEHEGPAKPPPERDKSFDELFTELDEWRAELDAAERDARDEAEAGGGAA